MANSHGEIYFYNETKNDIKVRISNSKLLRYLMRNTDSFKSLLANRLSEELLLSHNFSVQIKGKEIALFENKSLFIKRKVYLFIQYILAKLGF